MKDKNCLTVFYDKDFNQAIDDELNRLGLKHGQTAIVALPRNLWKWGKSVGMRDGQTWLKRAK